MKKRTLFYLIFTTVGCSVSYSQKAEVASANKKYNNYAYVDAIKTYERLAAKGYQSADMFMKLGNAYYFNADFEKAARSYEKLCQLQPEVAPEYYYRYAQSLKSIGKEKEAATVLAQFESKSGGDSRSKRLKKNSEYLEDIRANIGSYTIENAGINSKYSDYGSVIVEDQLIFTSARDTSGIVQRKSAWTGEHFTNLYAATVNEELIANNPKRYDANINSRLNEATPAFTKDGNTMYFTRNNYLDGKKGKDANKVTLLKIYKATLVNKRWTKVIELPFNSDDFSSAHPALSPDEQTLYFASDRPGTIGQSDLYKVAINSNGTYGKPINLGAEINTEGRETFPFVTKDNQLYFASDGHPGLGGLDVFTTKINNDGTFDEVENEGAEVNSPKDDFGYYRDNETNKGFFSSNRDGGLGSDDIYRFISKDKCKQIVNGTITDKTSGAVLAGVQMVLLNKKYKVIGETTTDASGNYSFKVDCRKTYSVRATKEEYTSKEVTIKIPEITGQTTVDLQLEGSICKVTVGDDLGKCFGIKMIYFDLDKSNIRKEAALDLAKILDVLQQNPTMKIDIRSHTDCRQTAKYNLALSERRAQSTIAWLVSKGIDTSRLTGKGYGESQLINDCGCEPTNQSNCTEEQHQMNRRSEFIVTAL
ncbi:OmpA family protein [Flavobacterium succinicans]|uniref:Outer membrane lipoprotein Omp16 n=3 Tax=Flavobacterium succinicans TaxID=29536 RepID=A0A199XS00_9FLAO|nr:OmpA family protein [Flavobacterium succinicans]OAZ04538.1 outer membrane lipoprotein Omp16 precursor [Flavobacterium succinicans]